MTVEPFRRFYKTVKAGRIVRDHAVLLDGRPLRTPARAMFAPPTMALAEACAVEWDAQDELVRLETMPLTRLVNVAIDFAPRSRAGLVNKVVKTAETDLLCHRAERPADLVARQNERWDPLLAWAAEMLEAPLVSAPGVLAHAQPPASLEAIAARARGMDEFALAGLAHAAGLSGSAVIAFAMAERWLGGGAAFAAGALDDLYGLEKWGEDGEARARLNNLRGEYLALDKFFAALDGA
ncbi:MAG: ATP12 family protein [Hyphomonadaceae bacterium]